VDVVWLWGQVRLIPSTFGCNFWPDVELSRPFYLFQLFSCSIDRVDDITSGCAIHKCVLNVLN
jgi:hypothetical protein